MPTWVQNSGFWRSPATACVTVSALPISGVLGISFYLPACRLHGGYLECLVHDASGTRCGTPVLFWRVENSGLPVRFCSTMVPGRATFYVTVSCIRYLRWNTPPDYRFYLPAYRACCLPTDFLRGTCCRFVRSAGTHLPACTLDSACTACLPFSPAVTCTWCRRCSGFLVVFVACWRMRVLPAAPAVSCRSR